MADTLPTELHLELVTPDRSVTRGSVTAVSIPGRGGYLGILPGHAPLLSELAPGEIAYLQGSVTRYLALSWGFAEVLPDRVMILAQTSERPEDIDVDRAQRAKKRAEERLAKSTEPDVDRDRARAALERAMTRLEVAGKKKV